MRGHCIICAELFVASSDISAITCGHTFHSLCLTQWTERSKTCPQCRIKLTPKSVIQKLYFDAGPDLEPEEDPDVLRNRNNHLEAEILKKNKEIAGWRQIVDDQVQLNEMLEKSSTTSKDRLKKEKDLTASLKIQLECLSNENKRCKLLEKDNATLTNMLTDYKNMEVILNGSDDEANKILKSHGRGSAQMDQLAKYCGVLKSELTTISCQKQRLVTKHKHLELEKARVEKEVNRMHGLEEAMTNMPAEIVQKDKKMHLLEEKLKRAEQKIELLSKVVSPNWLKKAVDVNHSAMSSTSPVNIIASNKENDSPMVAQCSVAASIAMARDRMHHSSHAVQRASVKADAELYKHFNIMHRSKPVFLNGKLSSAAGSSGSKDHGYDGLGGHSRPDIFPGGSGIAKRKIKVAASSKVSRSKGSNLIADAIIID